MPTIESNGVPIYYETKGPLDADHGETIVFAHGAGGNAAIWFNQMAHFAPTHRVVAFDHRCFGRTPVPPEALQVGHFRDDLLTLMDHLDVEAAHLVGQSMGGFTVLRTTLDAPDRVRTLTMSATSGGLYNPNPTQAIRDLTTSENTVSGIAATMAEATKTQPALMQLYESINNFNVHFNWGRLSHLLAEPVPVEALAEIRCPMLFIAGEEDPLFPPDLLASYVPHIEGGRIEVVANAGHSPYFERPEVFNDILGEHINSAAA